MASSSSLSLPASHEKKVEESEFLSSSLGNNKVPLLRNKKNLVSLNLSPSPSPSLSLSHLSSITTTKTLGRFHLLLGHLYLPSKKMLLS
ncbi:hypothetical protein H5410_025775 [Solanum commersonii]|uniref:Uncharacterized protein n=1 Tax=Solanum commersonii TaxID=4109 RepID=A0A9J5YU43_SOLCO|nr:hypothetical protein H5410_025775 [Solanum commersonii]